MVHGHVNVNNRGKGYVTRVMLYCHQFFVGGKYDLIQLHRKIYFKMMGYL